MKGLLVCLLLAAVASNGECGIVYFFQNLVNPYLDCLKNTARTQIESADYDIKTNDQPYGVQKELGDVEESKEVVGQEILLNYPDQQDINNGPTPLEVEMVDEIYFPKPESYRESDRVYYKDGVNYLPEVPDDQIETVPTSDQRLRSTRKYTLSPYTQVFVRSMVVRQNITHFYTRPVYIYGTMAIKFEGGKNFMDSDIWLGCKGGEKPTKFENGAHYVNIGTITTDDNYLTEDGEIVYMLRDMLHVSEEKVVMQINAAQLEADKAQGYRRLCPKE